MSVNVYLDKGVRELAGFKSQPLGGNAGDKLTFNGEYVFSDKSRLYLMWSEFAVIPDELKDLVEEISCYEVIPQMGARESGIYRHESAECELMPEDYGNAKREKPMYRLKIRAKKMEDIRALLHMVKTGTIRPVESYEEPQGGKTRRQLESELTQTQQQLSEARETIKEIGELARLGENAFDTYRNQVNSAIRKNAAVRLFVDELVSKGAWMIRGAHVVRRLSQILNSK